MGNIEHDDNDLEVEITDLDPIAVDSKFAALRSSIYTLITKISWQQFRSSAQRILLFCVILLLPLVINAYSTYTRNISAHECVRQRPEIVYVAQELVVSSGTQILPTDAPTTLYIQKYLPTSSIQFKALKIASSTCK